MGETEWSDEELHASVTAYFQMRTLEEAGMAYSKSDFRRSLKATALERRSDGAIEYRMQNISWLLEKRQLGWIKGYKPARNIGAESELRLEAIIDTIAKSNSHNVASRSRFSEIVPNSDLLMGAKAVFGPLSSHVFCFGSRGDANKKSYFSAAESVARRAVTKKFILAIGGGKNVRDGLVGRVLNLVEAGCVYGPTALLLSDPAEVRRLEQWPVSIALRNVWKIVDAPHLVNDLGFSDRTILEGAMDGVVGPAMAVQLLWDALREWQLEPAALPVPSNFYDNGTPTLARSMLPFKPRGKIEGEKIWTLQKRAERDPWLANEAKRMNAAKFGTFTCEACNFGHKDKTMFDAHHPTPLAVGQRTTFPEHLVILCPTCHRRAHRSGNLTPFSLYELQSWNSQGRR